jgi:hypothetical protein
MALFLWKNFRLSDPDSVGSSYVMLPICINADCPSKVLAEAAFWPIRNGIGTLVSDDVITSRNGLL